MVSVVYFRGNIHNNYYGLVSSLRVCLFINVFTFPIIAPGDPSVPYDTTFLYSKAEALAGAYQLKSWKTGFICILLSLTLSLNRNSTLSRHLCWSWEAVLWKSRAPVRREGRDTASGTLTALLNTAVGKSSYSYMPAKAS